MYHYSLTKQRLSDTFSRCVFFRNFRLVRWVFPSFTLFSKTWQTSHSDLLFYHFFGQTSLYLPGRRLTENIRTILCKVSSSKTFFTHSFLSGRWQLWPQWLERGQIPSNTLGPTSTWSLSKLLTQFLRMSVSHKFYHQHDISSVFFRRFFGNSKQILAEILS